MLVVKFVPTFSDNSMLFSAEDVAWQFYGEVIEGEVYLTIDKLISPSDEIVYDYQIVKHLMLQLHLFGVGIEGVPAINSKFEGSSCLEWSLLLNQIGAFSFRWDDKEGLVKRTMEDDCEYAPLPFDESVIFGDDFDKVFNEMLITSNNVSNPLPSIHEDIDFGIDWGWDTVLANM